MEIKTQKTEKTPNDNINDCFYIWHLCQIDLAIDFYNIFVLSLKCRVKVRRSMSANRTHNPRYTKNKLSSSLETQASSNLRLNGIQKKFWFRVSTMRNFRLTTKAINLATNSMSMSDCHLSRYCLLNARS